MLENSRVADNISAAGGVTTIQCENRDIWEKVRMTESAFSRPGPTAIVDGALAGSGCVIGFALMIVRADGMWEVYHLSSKAYVFDKASDIASATSHTMSDAAPLMYV
ncbi:MAG: hypothetical protein BZ138_06585, partial [Methanosphaera sp. rholeuAM270]